MKYTNFKLRLALSPVIIIFALSTLKTYSQEYAIGADLSFLKSAEDRGFGFRENDSIKPGLQIFRGPWI